MDLKWVGQPLGSRTPTKPRRESARTPHRSREGIHSEDQDPDLDPNTTPSSARSSRSKGFVNKKNFRAFQKEGNTFRIGDAVLVSPKLTLVQRWLNEQKNHRDAPNQRIRKPGESGSPTKRRRLVEEEDDASAVKEEDGLGKGVRVGIITQLFEDERGEMKAKLHWLVRPRILEALYPGWTSINLGEEDSPVQNELFYANDPDFLSEHPSNPLANLSSTSSNRRSLVETSRAEDNIQLQHILGPCRVTSFEKYDTELENAKARGGHLDANVHVFRVRRCYLPKPPPKSDFFLDLDWDKTLEYCLSSGVWELPPPSDGGDLSRGEPEPESDPDEDDTVEVRSVSKCNRSKVKSKASKRRRATPVHSEDLERSEEGESSAEEGSDADLQMTDQESDGADEDEEMLSDSQESEDEDAGSRRTRGRGKKASKASKASKPGPGLTMTAAARKKKEALAERRKQRMKDREARKAKGPSQPQLPTLLTSGKSWETATPFQRARAVLHVSATPDVLPCREDEFIEIETYLEDAIDEGSGTCIYIAGTPGTGKTATVHSVVKCLRDRAAEGKISPFKFIEINGMKITEPNQAFVILWEFISGKKCPPKHALTALENHFKTPSPTRETCVVLVDELDQLVTKKQDVIYNFFNWPNQPHARLIVIAVANTMDLPERELSGKIRSRLGSNRINFRAYDHKQLTHILKSRLEGLEVFAPDAVELAARKVAAVSGDARRALDICRRTVEKIEQENEQRIAKGQEPRLIKAMDIAETVKAMVGSGVTAFIKKASLHQKIMLLAVSRSIREAGVPQVEFGKVLEWHLRLCRGFLGGQIPSHEDLFGVLASLASTHLVILESNRLDHFQRVQAAVSDDDLELVLKQDPKLGRYVIG